ncbi:MAG TPA: signal peptide peptidase SppA [Saprospiraceae bacterium]|nr:signal peptide peptidase SppA [Saprospiraceae bacterium]HMP13631.1 signal peptide peptidase SppA [Saprospiraceae bacterium]
MGQFFKFLFASCLGVLLAMFVLFGIGSLVIVSIASQADKPAKVQPNSVLHLTFPQPVPEKTNNIQVVSFRPADSKILGLHDMLRALEQAKTDDNIKGVFLEAPNGVQAGMATVNTLRDALEDFRKTGKFVVTYGDYYTQGSYYLATVSEDIILNPNGLVDFRGFSAQIPFYKNMLDKIGVDMEVFYAGKYKSATEPFRRTNMSAENREQVREYLDETYREFLSDIARTRSKGLSDIRRMADQYDGFLPDRALESGVVDRLGYREDAMNIMRQKLGLKSDEKVKLLTLTSYFKNKPLKPDYSVKDKIAVVYAEGTILDGKAEYGSVGSTDYIKILQEVRRDKRVKAVVLRINSPGGSAIASENLWYEVQQIKELGKPVVVSMGDYAASGGYYIACLADTIVAEPVTLTGSIGVFSVIPIAQKMLNDKLGINFDTVSTGPFSVGISPTIAMSEAEKKLMQTRTDQSYAFFLKRVAEGRGMSPDQVNEIAQGRVWTGLKAKEIGLVDEIGDLNKALEIAAHMAGLPKYRLSEYPRTKEPLQQLLESLTNTEEAATEAIIRQKFGNWYPYYQTLKEIHDTKGVQARLMFIIPFR